MEEIIQEPPVPQKASGTTKYLLPYKSRKGIFFDNFLGGFAWSLGTLVGFALIIAVAGYFIARIDFVPIVGDWVTQIVQNATSKLQVPIQ